MSIPNIDDLFSKIDDIAERMNKTETKSEKSNKRNTEFKNLDMTFLGSVRGSYELKVFVDSDGQITEEVFLHTIKTNKEKVTVPCKGAECEICKRQEKLHDLKNKSAWRYRKYKLNKILVKIGDIPEGGNGIDAGKTYVAYVDDKFFKPLIDTVRVNQKYYKDDIAKMLTAKERSGGFLVTAARTGKTTTYNFNFIPSIEIDGVNSAEVFGSDVYKLVNQGYFRNNYIPDDKYKRAVSILDNLILNTVAPKDGKSSEKPNAEKEVKEEAVEEVKNEVEVENEPEAPTEPEVLEKEVEKIEVVEVEEEDSSEKDPNSEGDDGKPSCFSEFDPSDETCTAKCQYKRECLMDAMEKGKI